MKDLADSKRLYNTIRAMPNSVRSPRRGRKPVPASGIGPASATIISALYWPPLQPEAISLPEMVEIPSCRDTTPKATMTLLENGGSESGC